MWYVFIFSKFFEYVLHFVGCDTVTVSPNQIIIIIIINIINIIIIIIIIIIINLLQNSIKTCLIYYFRQIN